MDSSRDWDWVFECRREGWMDTQKRRYVIHWVLNYRVRETSSISHICMRRLAGSGREEGSMGRTRDSHQWIDREHRETSTESGMAERWIVDNIDEHYITVFPMSEAIMKKKKNGIRELFTASSKFSKNASRGVFLASIIYTEGKVLCSVDDCLPILPVNIKVASNDNY